MASGDATESRLVVAIRPRPLAGGVPPDGSLRFDCGTANAVACSSASSGTEEVLQFDRVFAPDAMNDDVYTAVAQPVVKAALRGINGAVAAYGQTSSGKTHTMRGTADDPGIVPRAVRVRAAAVAAAGASGCGAATRACGRAPKASFCVAIRSSRGTAAHPSCTSPGGRGVCLRERDAGAGVQPEPGVPGDLQRERAGPAQPGRQAGRV